ncbi:hypothetical protein CLAIMM_01308 isoform 1 [Cladophialophora immunda]|nr:hypothetical protein CLAIMM_01308 isoform 1 [Cladophialophora immunda]
MLLPSGYWATVFQSHDPLLRREPKNSDAPGLQDNKNGPPGPEGNQKGPPAPPAVGVTITNPFTPPNPLTLLPSPPVPDIVTPPFILPTGVPAPLATDEPSFLATTTSSLDPTSTLFSNSVTSTSLTESILSSTSFDSTTSLVSPSSFISQASTASNTLSVAGTATQVSTPTQLIPVTSAPAKTTSQSTIHHTTSATVMETPWGYQSQNGTTVSESHGTLSQGQKAGIAVGTLVGVSLILSLLYWLFRWRKSGQLLSMPRFGRRQQPESPNPRWPRNRPFNVLPDPPMEEAGLSDDPVWNHQGTIARPPMIAKVRQSLPRSLRFLGVNPLGMNPVTPPVSRPRTPTRKSFASSIFHRRSIASTLRSVSVPPSEEHPVPMRGPHFLRPLLIPPFRLQPAASMSAHLTEATKSASASTHSLAVPSQTLSRASQQQGHSTSSADRDPRSAKAIFDRTKPRLPSKLRAAATAAAAGSAGSDLPQRSAQDVPRSPPVPLRPVMPQRPVSTLSASWKREKILRPSNSLLDSHLDILNANAGNGNGDGDGDGDGDRPPPPPPKSPRRTSVAVSGKTKE